MAQQIVARFLVTHPVRPGMVRAILDTLSAQGGAYEPQLVRRAPRGEARRITWSRPSGLLDEVGQAGATTTFLRVAEGRPEPVLSFVMSDRPRGSPGVVTLAIPAAALVGSKEIEQVLGVCKGLYLFLESPFGRVGITGDDQEVPPDGQAGLGWANFLGPEIVSRLGPARLLTAMAFIVEILPDGGIMLVTHASPQAASTPEGRALCRHIEVGTGVLQALTEVIGDVGGMTPARQGHPRVRRRSGSDPST